MGNNHSSLAEQFASGATKGQASNMFIEDDTIYSYGKHFPIAKRLSHNEYLINSNSYSVSTAKHMSRVSSALRNKITWDCPNCDSNNIPEYIKENSTETFNKIQTAKSYISHYIGILSGYENYWNECKVRFEFRNSKIDKMFKSFVFNDKIKAKIAKYALIDKFLFAVRDDNVEEVAACIKAGVNVNAKNGDALNRAVGGYVGTTKLLLDNGAKITNLTLCNAIWAHSPATVKLLLEYGARIKDYTQFNYIKEKVELTNEIKGKLLDFELHTNSKK